jgi:hypothetical protein
LVIVKAHLAILNAATPPKIKWNFPQDKVKDFGGCTIAIEAVATTLLTNKSGVKK